MRLLFALGLLQRGKLAFGQHQAFLGDLGFERLEPFLHRLQIMALPDPANASRRDRMAELAKLVGDADLAISRLVQRKLDDDASTSGGVRFFRIGLRRVSSCSANSPPASYSSLNGKSCPAIADHFAGLADIAELPGQLQQPDLGADDLLFLGHRRCPFERRGRALRTPTTPRPASASASAMTPTVRLSLNYCR